MIKITQYPLADTRTSSKSCKELARCTVDGVDYEATSRYGASAELARVLVAAGIPDQPVEVWDQGGAPRGRQKSAPSLRWSSLHGMALWAYDENAKQPLRRVRWRPAPDLRAVFGEGRIAQNGGEAVGDGELYPAAAELPKNEKRTPLRARRRKRTNSPSQAACVWSSPIKSILATGGGPKPG